jgi:hypothetical protein
MSRRTVIITAAIVAVIAGGTGATVGAIMAGGDSGSGSTSVSVTQDPTKSVPPTSLPTKNTAVDPTTNPASEPTAVTPPPSTRNPVLPIPATGSLTEGREKVLLDGKLTIPNTPAAWEETASDKDSATFDDKSNCSSACPKIWVYDTTKGQNHNTFGDDPLTVWAADVCDHSTQGPTSSADFMAGDKPAVFRLRSCQAQDFYAWWIPGEKVLVTTQAADGGRPDPNIVQAALERAVWQ